jgi:hypothetical protein
MFIVMSKKHKFSRIEDWSVPSLNYSPAHYLYTVYNQVQQYHEGATTYKMYMLKDKISTLQDNIVIADALISFINVLINTKQIIKIDHIDIFKNLQNNNQDKIGLYKIREDKKKEIEEIKEKIKKLELDYIELEIAGL